MNKNRKNKLTKLKLNMLNEKYKNSKVRYVNKRHIKFNDDNKKMIIIMMKVLLLLLILGI